MRSILLALVHLGIVGLLVELFLLEHTESATQWIPVVALLLGLAVAVAVAIRPTPRRLAVFRAMMAIFVVAGALGLVLHFRGNLEFELENDPSLRGMALVWEALRGATPTLAPGALFQLGLLGLAYTFRHPALGKGTPHVPTRTTPISRGRAGARRDRIRGDGRA
jgi:hypothetical protein